MAERVEGLNLVVFYFLPKLRNTRQLHQIDKYHPRVNDSFSDIQKRLNMLQYLDVF